MFEIILQYSKRFILHRIIIFSQIFYFFQCDLIKTRFYSWNTIFNTNYGNFTILPLAIDGFQIEIVQWKLSLVEEILLIILRLFGRYPFYFEIICRTPKNFFMTLPNGRYKLWCKFAQIVFFIFWIFETPKKSVLEKIVSNKSKILTTKLILCRIAKISWFFLVPKNEDFLHCIGGIDFRKVSIYIFEKSKYFRIFTHFGEINLFSSMRRSVWACRFWILWNKWK